MFKSATLLLITALLYEISAYKFLVIFPIPGKSHSILGYGVVKHLAKAGHEVTYITAYPPEQSLLNVTVIDTSDKLIKYTSGGSLNIKELMDKTGERNSIFTYVPMVIDIHKLTLEHPNVQKIIDDKTQHFDAVIVEWLYIEVFAGFAGLFKCPLIWFSPMEPHWMIMQLIDEIPNSAYIADLISDSIAPFSFIQRFVELYYQTQGKILQLFWISGLENEIYQKHFVPGIRERGSIVPSLETLKYNASLVLSNSHFSMGKAVRLPPSFISLGGYHIEENIKPLPETLQKLMDNSKHGVIYFSMGSNLRGKFFPDVVKRELLEVFGKLKQTVLWKFEEDLPNRPSNVHIMHWAPQHSILAHKNCVLFITHGGLLSTTETIHFGVPIIGIPGYADQFGNVERTVKMGFATKVDLSYNMAADLQTAIEEMINNPKYTAKVKELSELYHDRLIKPSKELVHWVEHVVKTQGALHLRSPALMTPWYQKLYLDLILVLFLFSIVIKSIIILLKNKILRQEKHLLNYVVIKCLPYKLDLLFTSIKLYLNVINNIDGK